MNVDTTHSNGRDIAPPASEKRPARVNAFNFARGAGSALLPLFPYLGDGDIVPCISVIRGGSKHEGSVFEHTNTVDEVAITFGARGSFLRVGQVMVGEKKHTVGSFLPKDPEGYVLMVITQRQAESGVEQKEAWSVICGQCSEPLVDYHFDSKPDYRSRVPGSEGYAEPLPTIIGSFAGAMKVNASVESRTCKKCGHVQEPFQVGTWHWDVYEEQSWCVDQSLIAYGKESSGG
jgi:hypothetical protein